MNKEIKYRVLYLDDYNRKHRIDVSNQNLLTYLEYTYIILERKILNF